LSRLTKTYLAVLLLLVLGFGAMLADATMATRAGNGTGPPVFAAMAGHSLAVPYYEARWRVLGDDSGPLFPGMRPLSTMDFVYAP
jgi:hypothetical protein